MIANRRVKLLDFDKLCDSISNKRYLNEDLLDSPNRSMLIDLLHATESSLDFTPTCECRTYRGMQFEGMTCPFCGCQVSSEFVTNFDQRNWVRVPDNMPPILHPVFYLMLKSWVGKVRTGASNTKNAGKKQRVPIIDFILNPEETLPEEITDGVHGQGFRYFTDNFDEIMHYLLYEHPKYSKNKKTEYLQKVYEEYRDILLIRRFPIMHQSFHPTHATTKVKQIDETANIIIPAIIDLANATFSKKRNITQKKYIDTQLYSIYKRYIDYIKKNIEYKIGDKFALVRRHVISGRLNWSARAVISPLVCRHIGDEIHLPWDLALNGYKLEIINLLMRDYSYTQNEALAKVMKGFMTFDEEIYSCMNKLIEECPFKGLPVSLGRNPTLLRSSMYFVFATKCKRNIHDKSLNIPPRICKGLNADYDGDALWLILIKEQGLARMMLNSMHPREHVLSEVSLGLSDWINPTLQTFVHFNSFLLDCHKEDYETKLSIAI